MRNRSLAAVALLLMVGGSFAAEPTVIKLSDVKVKASVEGVDASLFGYNEGEGKIFFYVNGTATTEFEAKEDGEVKILIEVSGDMGEKDRAKFKLTVGGKVIEKEFELKQNDAKEYEFKAEVKKGKQAIAIEFLNDQYKENVFDCNLYIHAIKIKK